MVPVRCAAGAATHGPGARGRLETPERAPAGAASGRILEFDEELRFPRLGARCEAHGPAKLRLRLIRQALVMFFAREDRVIRVIGGRAAAWVPASSSRWCCRKRRSRAAMIRYGLNVLGLSIIIR